MNQVDEVTAQPETAQSVTRSHSTTVRKEIRFSIVMYGGVSLAIYENGIAQEFLGLVRSTARRSWNAPEFRYGEDELRGAEPVYRKLAQELSESGDNGVRFVVDVISGTSAGGINGIFLAKALANAQSMDGLKKLWIEDGDIDKLLNDAGSRNGTSLPKPKQPAALLNGQWMYWKLLDAFDEMDAEAAVTRKVNVENLTPGEALVDELELYVTTTDIRGRVTPLRTYDRLVFERRHRFGFEFSFLPPLGNRVQRDSKTGRFNPDSGFEYYDNPILALAARCTSSFPFAFEPMRLQLALDVLKLRDTTRPQRERWKEDRVDFWKEHFFAPEHEQEEKDVGFRIENRSFGDGGYVDNKPFGFAIDALAHITGVVPSERKLVFIEPAPEHPERETVRNAKQENTPPNAIENAWAALVSVPGYETIREDLLRVNERGRLIRKINELITFVAKSAGSTSDPRTGKSISEIAASSLSASSYYLLRAFDLTDLLANVIAEIAGISPHSSYFFALRMLVRELRERGYQSDEKLVPPSPSAVPTAKDTQAAPGASSNPKTLLHFLDEFDLWFHIRRLRFLASELASLYRLDAKAQQRLAAGGIETATLAHLIADDDAKRGFRDALDYPSQCVDIAFSKFRKAERELKVKGGEVEKAVCKAFDEFASATKNPNFLSDQLGAENVGADREDRSPYASRSGLDNDYYALARNLLDKREYNKAAQAFVDVGEKLRQAIQNAIAAYDSFDKLLSSAPRPNAPFVDIAIELLKHYWNNFEKFDCVIFPVLYETEIGSLDQVDIIRFSPEDATAIVDEQRQNRYKLAGITLGHFGAFLEKEWRRFDMLWGRLDAAERIIRSLLPASHPKVDDLISEARDAILWEELGPDEGLQAVLTELTKISPPVPESYISRFRESARKLFVKSQ